MGDPIIITNRSGDGVNPATDGAVLAVLDELQKITGTTSGLQLQRISFSVPADSTDFPIITGIEGTTIKVYEYVITAGTASGTAVFTDDLSTSLGANFNIAQYGGHLRVRDMTTPYYQPYVGSGLSMTTVGCSIDGELLYSQE